MKRYLFLLPLLVALHAQGQFDRKVFMDFTGNFFAGQKAFNLDNAGYGLSLDASFPGYSRWQVTVSPNAGHFFGDKILYIPDEGRVNDGPVVYNLFAGPQYFITKRIAISLTAGLSWYSIHTRGFSTGAGYQAAATGFLGKKRRFVLKFLFTEIPKKVKNLQYMGIGVGYRFL